MKRMLLGETQRDLAQAIKEYFSSKEFVVEIESNGMRILERLNKERFDVVVLEMSLLDIDGIGIVIGYRATGGSIPILMLSGRHSSGELKKALDAGADSYIVKPFILADFAAQVTALLRRPLFQSQNLLVSGNLVVNIFSGTVTKNRCENGSIS